MAVEKELQHLKNRLLELAERSYSHGIYTYTPFLGLSEQQVFYEVQRDAAYAGFGMEGGSPLCERKMIRFGSPDLLGYDEEYPIRCLMIEPLTPKYAEHLTHRDFLGAIMNLGVERGVIGDIFIQDKEAIVFCHESIAEYLTESVEQVKHTHVKCAAAEVSVHLREPVREEISFSVSSPRVDTVIARVYSITRSHSLELFKAGRVFVNGRLIENSSYALRSGDAVTARGFGRFIYVGEQGETRKGKMRISVEVYR